MGEAALRLHLAVLGKPKTACIYCADFQLGVFLRKTPHKMITPPSLAASPCSFGLADTLHLNGVWHLANEAQRAALREKNCVQLLCADFQQGTICSLGNNLNFLYDIDDVSGY